MIKHLKKTCTNRSSMNGFCLLCNHKQANLLNKNKDSMLVQAINSLKIGFK